LKGEIKIDNKKKDVGGFVKKYAPSGYYFMKCGCGIFTTDYPFVSECCKCEFKYAGSSEDIEKWKKEGILMELLVPKSIPTKKRAELINAYESENEVLDEDLYDCDDIWGF